MLDGTIMTGIVTIKKKITNKLEKKMKKIIQILICMLIGIFVATENPVLAAELEQIMLSCQGRNEISSYCEGYSNIKTEYDESCYYHEDGTSVLYDFSTICTDLVTEEIPAFVGDSTCTIKVTCSLNIDGRCASGAYGTPECTTTNNIISCTGCTKCPDYEDAVGKIFTGQSISGNNEERSDCYITTSAANPISDDIGKYYFSENSGKCNASSTLLDPIDPIIPL